MDYTTILFEIKEQVAVITLNRPEKKNALNRQMSRDLIDVFGKIETDDGIKAVVLTGGPDCFCAGADLSEVQASEGGEPPVEPGMGEKIRYLPKPTIAAIGGYCIAGGLEIAMRCDIRIASEDAKIGDGHIKMGLLGLGGGVVMLPRLVGEGMAKELIFTGDFIDGKEAYRIGLVNHIYPRSELINQAVELAGRIAQHPPTAMKYTKRAIDAGLQMDESEAIRYSEICNDEVLASSEYKEKVARFLKEQ